jgi:hypothetical protein
MRRGRRLGLLAVAIATAALAGCGSGDEENEDQPPSPIELTAKIGEDKVLVSPSEIGAGLVNLTISNQTPEDVQLEISGPTQGSTDPIVGNGVGEYKINLEEGEYEVSADTTSISPGRVTVGPERESAQNDLLLP